MLRNIAENLLFFSIVVFEFDTHHGHCSLAPRVDLRLCAVGMHQGAPQWHYHWSCGNRVSDCHETLYVPSLDLGLSLYLVLDLSFACQKQTKILDPFSNYHYFFLQPGTGFWLEDVRLYRAGRNGSILTINILVG